jgi:DNA (cytosine-5)-methyltransferase 1
MYFEDTRTICPCERIVLVYQNKLKCMPNYLTIKQTAKLLHVTTLTLRNWDKAGKFKAYRHPINNYRVYKLDQVELFLRRLEATKAKKEKRKIDVY